MTDKEKFSKFFDSFIALTQNEFNCCENDEETEDHYYNTLAAERALELATELAIHRPDQTYSLVMDAAKKYYDFLTGHCN